ncbi:hypothetical protein BJ684DRAFT_17173 [Piptocephalis cylindrospora]|uniref:RGS domain-containing protein n=1 Tax=Piptocephalis cylindrospora TaxID=1907219 RepID=A0A4P9Y3C3_9FUNG|nr:hypothetical protein BJ684DRAFT_17173 [Piptocephalis cylindrospora]|eukprot:RKP12330.1 hypothetical protein BJ684DRAFT_17173 [Piptocephalis cylindrospora]
MLASSILYYVYLSIWSTLTLGSLWLFFRYRQEPAIRLRDPILSIVSALLMLLLTNVHLVRLARRFEISCALLLWIPTYCLPLIALLTMTRFIRLVHLYRMSIQKLEQGVAYLEQGPPMGEDDQAVAMITVSTSPAYPHLEDSSTYSHLERISSQQSLVSPPSAHSIGRYLLVRQISMVERIVHGLNSFLTRNILSILCMGYITTMTVVLFFIFTTSSKFNQGTTKCAFGWEYVPLYAILFLTALPAVPAILGTAGLKDAYGICLEMNISAAIFVSSFIGALIFNILQATTSFDLPSFPATLWAVWACISLHYVLILLPLYEVLYPGLPPMPSRPHPGTLTSNPEGNDNSVAEQIQEANWTAFIALFHQPERLKAFREYAVSEFSVENVLFIERLWGIRQARLRKSEAGIVSCMRLYDQFFRSGADLELNLQGETMADLRRCVEGSSSQPPGISGVGDDEEEIIVGMEDHGSLRSLSLKMFDQAEAEILKLMYESTYPRFLRLQTHEKYQQDLNRRRGGKGMLMAGEADLWFNGRLIDQV